MRDVIHEVERQTRMSFIYKADAIDESQHVTATFSRTPIKKVLRNILPEGVSFSILIMNCLTPLINNFCQKRMYGGAKKNEK